MSKDPKYNPPSIWQANPGLFERAQELLKQHTNGAVANILSREFNVRVSRSAVLAKFWRLQKKSQGSQGSPSAK